MQNRIERLQGIIPDNCAVMITNPSNIFYFTGLKSSNATIMASKNSVWYITDFRYYEKARKTLKSQQVVLQDKINKQINDFLNCEGTKTLFIETDFISVEKAENLSCEISAEISHDNKISNEVKKMRSIKDADELQKIKAAQEITDRSFEYILGRIAEGRTERDIMLDLEFFMRKNGSEGVAFEIIAVSGKNSSLPHGRPTDKKICRGDFLTLDFGACYGGYRSDMTRTVVVGGVNEEQRLVYETVLKAQKEALSAISAGKVCSEIDKIARDIIYSSGFEGCFGHSLGHSVGIDIHEGPAFSPSCNEILSSGMVITVEPGIYIENRFGVRIEDMIVVKDDGCENITASAKELIIV